MTYLELYNKATDELFDGHITIAGYEEMIKPLEREIPEDSDDCVSRKEVHNMLENLPVTYEDKWFNWLQKACNRLAALPSFNPKTITKEQIVFLIDKHSYAKADEICLDDDITCILEELDKECGN